MVLTYGRTNTQSIASVMDFRGQAQECTAPGLSWKQPRPEKVSASFCQSTAWAQYTSLNQRS